MSAQRIDVPAFFDDLICFLSSRDDLAGFEVAQTELAKAAVAELISAAQMAATDPKGLNRLGVATARVRGIV